MLHAVLGTYSLCFAGGMALVVVSALASRRLAVRGLRDFAILFSAATLVLLVEAMKTYEKAVGGDFGPGLHIAGVALSVLGNAGMAWYLIALSLQVVGTPASRRFRSFLRILAVVAACLGGLKEAAALIWTEPLPGILLYNADYAALLGIHVGAGAILLAGYTNIEPPRLQATIRAYLVYLGVFSILAIGQLAAQDIPSAPSFVHDYPLAELLYYLGLVVAGLILLARYFSEPAQGLPQDLAAEFISRFGISNREREIIEMMARGFSNGAIAEKLFISTVTVKNHIYHIYRKTGAVNKVQLLNLMNSLK